MRLMMAKTPLHGEYHRRAGFVTGGDGVVVVYGSAGLDDGGDAVVGGGGDGVSEGEESVGGHDGAL